MLIKVEVDILFLDKIKKAVANGWQNARVLSNLCWEGK